MYNLIVIRSIGPIFGTILEYCETSLLIFYAHAIASEIFPESGVLAVYCVPLISIIFRPLGGYLIGLIGDKHGPESAMRISSLLMSASSFLMCFLPSYQEIGIYSQLLLVILRGAQMLSAGGELNFAAISLINVAMRTCLSFIKLGDYHIKSLNDVSRSYVVF